MKSRLFTYLTDMPARELYLACGGIFLIAAALLFVTLRPAFQSLLTVRTEKLQLEKAVADSKMVEQITTQLADDIKALSDHASKKQDTRSLDQLVVDVMGELNRTSNQHKVILGSVVPGTAHKVLMFDEVPFDIEVNGSYQDIMGWLRELESRIDTLSISRLEITHNEASDELSAKVHIAVYREAEPGK